MSDLAIVIVYAKQTGADTSSLSRDNVIALCDHCLAKSDAPAAPITTDLAGVHAAANAVKGQL